MTPNDDDISDDAMTPAPDDVPPAPATAPRDATRVALELLRYGLIEFERKPNVYRDALMLREAIAAILAPLDLAMRIDEIRGLAFVATAQPLADVVDDSEDAGHPLVRRQRLTLEQSLLVAILRQHFVAHELDAGVGASHAQVALDDLVPQLRVFVGDPGSETQERKRLLTLLEQLKGHGLVSDVDTQERVSIRPIIAHVANPENLTVLIAAMRAAAGLSSSADGSPAEDAP